MTDRQTMVHQAAVPPAVAGPLAAAVRPAAAAEAAAAAKYKLNKNRLLIHESNKSMDLRIQAHAFCYIQRSNPAIYNLASSYLDIAKPVNIKRLRINPKQIRMIRHLKMQMRFG